VPLVKQEVTTEKRETLPQQKLESQLSTETTERRLHVYGTAFSPDFALKKWINAHNARV
jgi:hypothetical protein